MLLCTSIVYLTLPSSHHILLIYFTYSQFKPEFLNRIDDTIIFNSLSKDNLRGIVSLEVRKLERRLAERDIAMIITPAALDTIASIGYDPNYGARPLKRAIQRELETAVAKGILRGDFADGDEVTIDSEGGSIVIRRSGVGSTGNAQSMTQSAFRYD
jgi:ATP-dependent Clp protease ATP-binding subunit ClpB